MKKITSIISLVAVALLAVSCGSADKMAKQAELVTVKCDPGLLVVKGGNVDADLAVSYPKGYFAKKAVLEVTPVIVHRDGEVALEPIMFQGENVKNNYTVVPYNGGTINQHVCFAYVDGMAKSTLELRSRCSTNNGKKWVTLPTKKVADGCNITETLACAKGFYSLKDSGYQYVITLTPEGQVLYRINSAEVRGSELKGKSVKEFKEALKEIEANERKELKSIDVVAYASPDGAETLNNKLSDNRSKSADKAFAQVTKGDKTVKGVDKNVKSVGEDWKGFQEIVNGSDIEDKDLILRVLSMYNDPNVREREIRNMSSIFQDLADEVLPQLRRARFIANVEYTNYSDVELLQLIRENDDILDETALLKAATLCEKVADKKALYNKAVDKYASENAKFNLACVALDEKDAKEAKKQIANAEGSDPDVLNLKGVCALRDGDRDGAKKLFEQSKTADAKKNIGLCAIFDGDYAKAAANCGNKGTEAALANLLNGDVNKALNCLKDCTCAKGDYIRAICYTRMGKTTEARQYLDKATKADPKLASRALNDVEFETIR